MWSFVALVVLAYPASALIVEQSAIKFVTMQVFFPGTWADVGGCTCEALL